MNNKKLQEGIKTYFPVKPTNEQNEVIKDISEFICTIGNRSIIILKWYAGTGKTTLIASLIKALPILAKRSVLLAPTGRAAKVLSNYSSKSASTIHKKIYWIKTNKNGNTFITLKENKYTNTIFIVDEASMIAENSDNSFGNRSILEDLIKFIYTGIDCKLILIGDTAQLPPVNLDIIPALNEEKLEQNYHKQIICRELKNVVRQKKDSLILKNATIIREKITNKNYSFPKISINNKEIIHLTNGEELQDALENSYNNQDINSTILICRSNKRANLYNQEIRTRIRWQENEISAGDILMVVRNNYYWLEKEKNTDFIANGDIIKVINIMETIERYGFSFVKANIKLLDYKNDL